MAKNKIYKGMTKTAIAAVLASSLVAPSIAQAAEFDFYDATGVNQGNLQSILLDDLKFTNMILGVDSYKYELGGKAYQVTDVMNLLNQNPGLTIQDPTLAQKVTEAGLVGEEIPTQTLEVQSVAAITTAVASGSLTTPQFVELTVNDGKVVTLDDLKEAGYTVEFLATKAVFAGGASGASNSTTGELKDALTSADNFSYKVVITKGEEKFESSLVSVTIKDGGKVVTPTELALTLDATGSGSSWMLPYITMDNSGAATNKVSVIVSKGLDFAGKEVDANKGNDAYKAEALVQDAAYTSSNRAVALISNTGEITPLSPGMTTITVKVGEKSISLDVEVKESPKATAIKETSMTVAASSAKIDLTVLDQYGEALRKNSETLTVTTESGKTTVINGLANKQSTLSVLSFTGLTLTQGKETIVVKSGDKVIGKVAVEVIDTATGTVDGYKIVAQSGKDLELDVYGSDNTVNIEFQEYVGAAQKGSNLSVPAAGFSVKSTNEDVATVETTGVTTVTAKKEGTTTIQYLQGSVVVAEATVIVKNTTPQITDITLKEGKTAIEVTGNVSDNKTVVADIFDELNVKFADGTTTMDKISDDLTLKEIASIVESNGNITLNTHNGSVAATATAKDVEGTQIGSLAIKIADNYGGQTFVFDVIVKDIKQPTISTAELTTAGTKAKLEQLGGTNGVNITAKNVGVYGNDIKVVVEENTEDSLAVTEDVATKTVTIKYANSTNTHNTGTKIADAASAASLTLVDIAVANAGTDKIGSTHITDGTNLTTGANQVITLTFSEKMNTTTLSQLSDITINANGPGAARTIGAAEFVWDTAGKVLTITVNNATTDVVSTDVITATNAKDTAGNAVDIAGSSDKTL